MKKNYPLLLVQELTYIQPEGTINMYTWQVTDAYYNICILIIVPDFPVSTKFTVTFSVETKMLGLRLI